MIYLDYAASSPMFPEAAEELLRCCREDFANPSGLHQASGRSRAVLHRARARLAELLDVPDSSIVFCSGGTEANAWAFLSLLGGTPGHIIAGAAEHASVLNSARFLQGKGFELTLLRPDGCGRIRPEDLEKAVRPDTRLISIQAANNETGVIQDIEALSDIGSRHGIPFHCDAVQSFGHCRLPLHRAALVSLSAHKLGGPRGIGCLVIRPGIRIRPLLFGGNQEFGLRPGTENPAAASSFAIAASMACRRLPEEENRIRALRNQLMNGIRDSIPGTVFHTAQRMLPGILSCGFPGLSGEETVMRLDLKGICVSSGSSCASSDPSPSHVLLSMGIGSEEAKRTVRFSLGRNTTPEEIRETLAALSELFQGNQLRKGI